jgi:uncharacterized protein (DUF697 family)
MSTEPIAADAAVIETETNEQKSLKLTRHYALWSMGGGLIPLAGLDLAAVIAAQIKMLHEMSKLYGVEFKENRAKSIVYSLIGSLGIVPIGTGIAFSLLKFVPIVGFLASTVALPISAGAITYATGKVFTAHFESGGTLLDFNAAKMKAAYRAMFDEGKTVLAKENEVPAE